MTLAQIVLAFAIAFLWVRLLAMWRLRNWRAVGLAGCATLVILAAGLLPNPVGGVIQTVIWGGVLWVFLFRMDIVGVMLQEEYSYVEDYVQILGRIDRRRRARNEPSAEAYVRAFNDDVNELEHLAAPKAWKGVQASTVRELKRRSEDMETGVKYTSEERLAAESRWLEVEQMFRDVLKVRAGFWTGWPLLRRTEY